MIIMLCVVLGLFIVYKMAASMNDAREAREAAEAAAKEASVMVAEYKYTDAIALSYRKGDGEAIEMEIRDNRWIYKKDPTLPLNQMTVAYMANALASIGAVSEVSLDGADTASFGLDNPEWTFTVSYKNASGTPTEHTYIQGNYNEFGKGYYFQEVGIERVYLVVEGLTQFFEYDLAGIADTGTFPVISADQFDSVDITLGGETRHLTGDDIADAFITLCDTLKPADFVAHHLNDDTRAQYGLTNPTATVTVNYKETITVADTGGATSNSTVEQIRSFTMHLGDTVEEDGAERRAYMADGYIFIYDMPESTAQSMLTYFASAEPAE